MATTLTREALLSKSKPIYREVDVKGFGRVGIRQQSEMRRIQRTNQLFDGSGNVNPMHADRRRVYMLIDQLMVDESTPMFSESDIETLMDGGSEHYDPLITAIGEFNKSVDPEKNDGGESNE